MNGAQGGTAELLVIGGGPGGYVAAIRAAQLGLDVTLVEAGEVGGVCLNVGCIPSKALISAADLFARARQAETMGLLFEGARVDLGRLQDWKAGVVRQLTGGVRQLLQGNGVRLVHGRARLLGPGRARIEPVAGAGGVAGAGAGAGAGTAVVPPQGSEIAFRQAVLATGSRPAALKVLPFDGRWVLDATGALALRELPAELVVVGGGYIGIELGTVYAKLGSRVTVVEALPEILGGVGRSLVTVVERQLRKLGVTVHKGAQLLGGEPPAGGSGAGRVAVRLADGREVAIPAEKVLVSVGRRPNSEELGLESVGLSTDEKGFLPVDGQRRTRAAGIFAIGDLAGGPLLAHKASHEGIVAAEAAAGRPTVFEPRAVPAVIFSDPEIATAGLTEEEARAQGIEPVSARFNFAANGRALGEARGEGFVQLVADASDHALLGVQIVGPDASSLIAEGVLAIEMGATLEDLALTIHAHPTLPETLMEAAALGLGQPIHTLLRRRPEPSGSGRPA
ncbi:MAG: dihydrolipoyl dehydrogenase [Bacillota bacterium]|nr:dihydrolipoyl dehydrogenase [Bacillota bacterium]